MWSFPTITMRFPSNIPGAIGHHWTSSIAMATPVAHKGATQGAKAYAMTIVDLLTRPDLLKASKDYFVNVQKAPENASRCYALKKAGDLAEQGHDGPLPARAAQVLLRPDQVQVVSRAARHRVSAADA